MVKFTSSKGETYDFHLDLERILELEAEDPEFSIEGLTNKLGERFRFTELVKMVSLLGWDYKEFCDRGFYVNDLSAIIVECMSELGFTSAEDTQST